MLLGCVLLCVPAHATAQGQLVGASLEIRLNPQGVPARALVRSIVRVAPGSSSVPIAVVLFGTTVTDISAQVDGVPADVTLERAARRWSGAITLPPGSGGRDVTLELAYSIDGAWPAELGRVRVPVLAPTWPPAAALPGTVSGVVRLATGTAVWDPFPSTLRVQADGRTATFDVQVVPALVTFSAGAAGAPLLTRALLIEGLAVGLVLAFAVFGWRLFRSEA